VRDKPMAGMNKKAPKRHEDAKQDKVLVKKMVKKACIK